MNELESKIKDAQDAYYNGEPMMSDAEFDNLWDTLVKKYPNSELLKTVGTDSSSVFNKVEHKIIMGSQRKANTAEEMDEYFNSTVGPWVVEYKCDGISVELIYKNGTFVQAVTRGNGLIGDDITENVRKMKCVPPVIDTARIDTFIVRGEILLFKSDKEKYFPEAKNCRNMASGIAKRIDGSGCEHLTVVCYDAVGKDFKSEYNKMTYLQQLGFHAAAVDMFKTGKGEKAIETIVQLWNILYKLPYDIDGLVFKQDSIDTLDMETNYRPKTQIALKPARNEARTTIKDIEWHMTNGTLTPVGIIEPVELDGTTVSRVNLHNPQQMLEKGIEIGKTVIIVKRGMIIPHVERVIE